MPIGRSGRMVVEFDPELKRRLHARLRSEGRDFRGWLLERVNEYLRGPAEAEGAALEGEAAARDGEKPAPELGDIEKRVLEAVSSRPRARHHADHLADATGIDVREIHAVLLRLELAGLVVQESGLYRRVRPS